MESPIKSRSGIPRRRSIVTRDASRPALGRLGETVRSRRLGAGLTQTQLANVSNVGIRFISELEHGKPTLEIGKVLDVLEALGLRLEANLHRPVQLDGQAVAPP